MDMYGVQEVPHRLVQVLELAVRSEQNFPLPRARSQMQREHSQFPTQIRAAGCKRRLMATGGEIILIIKKN